MQQAHIRQILFQKNPSKICVQNALATPKSGGQGLKKFGLRKQDNRLQKKV